MLADLNAEQMWTIAGDRATVRMQIPPLVLAGFPEPLRIHLDFDAGMIDDILRHLTVLRSRMLPSAPLN